MTSPTLRATAVTVACVMPVFLVGGLAVQIGDELGFSPAGLGLAVAVYFAVSALTSVPAGAVVERYGARAGARAGILLAAACLLSIAVAARGFPALVVLLAAGAAANGLGQLAANAALAGVPADRQGLSFGIKQAAIPTATLLSGLSVPVVALTIGWRWAFVVAAVVATASLALVPRAPARPAGPGTGRAGPAPQRATGALLVVGVSVALAAASAGSLGTFLVDSAASRGVAPGLAGLMLTLGSAACIASRVGAGALVDRWRRRGDVSAVVVLLAAGAVGLALLAAPGTVPLVTGVLLGFGFGWAFPGLVTVAVVQLHPHAPAAATSITQTGVYAGACVGPLAFGAAAATGGYRVAWLAAAVGMVLAAALMLVGRHLLHAHRARLASPAQQQ